MNNRLWKSWINRSLSTLASVLLLASCGGGKDEQAGAEPAAATGNRMQALAARDSLSIPADAATRGMFGPVQDWPMIPIHAALTSDGRMLTYGSDPGAYQNVLKYDIWNPDDNSHLTLDNTTSTDLFCGSQLMLAGGDKIFVAGGDNWVGPGASNTGNNNSNLFDVGTRTLTRQSNMNRARWYSTSTMLLNGEVYIQGGVGGQDLPEVRAADGSFRLLTTANTNSIGAAFPRNFIAPDGRVFGYDGGGGMYYVDPSGTGSITRLDFLPWSYVGYDSSAAMFAPGRILQFGGTSANALVVDITGGGNPVITYTGSLSMSRLFVNATVLPDGQVLATGGGADGNVGTNVAYHAEIWNPASGVWSRAAAARQTRLYHSTALLLPDATVMVGGGGTPGPEWNYNVEIFYPPYLFKGAAFASRPTINSAPTVVNPGSTAKVSVAAGSTISRVTFVKTGSVTHSFNMDQRFVDLPFNGSGTDLSVQIPSRASDVPPGMWMMFVIDSNGVPSVAKMVRVNVAPALNTAVTPVLTALANQSTYANTAATLQLSATDPNGDTLRYSASGLPAGLSIDPATGLISGTPTTVGSFNVSVAASDGYNSASGSFTWTVKAKVPLVVTDPTVPAPSVSGATASFNVSATGNNVRYSWDFGDGTPATAWSSSGSATHTYAKAGIFYVTVTIVDDVNPQQTRMLMHQVYLTPTGGAPTQSSNIVLEPRSTGNARLWVVNADNDSVSVFDSGTSAKLAEIAVGTGPRSLALAADGSVWVVNKTSATISVISASTLTVSRTISLARGSQPFGIAMAPGSASALVALEATGQLLKISTTSFATTATLNVGSNVRHVSVASDGKTAYVSRFITPPIPGESTATVNTTGVGGEVVVVDSSSMTTQRTILLAHGNTPDSENTGRGIPNYLGAVAISPDGSQAYVPSKQDNIKRGATRDGLPLNFQNTVRAISSRIVLSSQTEDLASRIDHDNASVASAAAFDPLGVYLFVALETSREVAVLDAFSRREILRIDVGRAPQGLVVSPDRKTLFVHNFMDRTVSSFDLTPLTVQDRANVPLLGTMSTVGTEKLTATVLKGKQFFYDARDTRLARDRYMSCAACHNDGGADGRVWDLKSQGEGLRNTISLRGRAGAQGRLHWSNNFDEVQDFEGQIRTLAGGTGLMTDAQFNTGTRSQPLGDAKAGVSADLDALAAYVGSLNTFDPSPYRPNATTLSAAAADGKTVFMSQNCASCHSGPSFTRSGVDNPANIGTIKATSGNRLNGPLSGIDVPTLRDVWQTAPYLHDGSAPTLAAAVKAHNNLTISDADITRVVAYLREIGSDEPSAPFASGGLTAEYFSNTLTLSGTPSRTQTDKQVNWYWAADCCAPLSVRWSGRVVATVAGNYRFQAYSGDGMRLWLNGKLVIDNWTPHAPVSDFTPVIAFAAGEQVDLVMEFFHNNTKGSIGYAALGWLKPGDANYSALPPEQLIPLPAGVAGKTPTTK